MGIQKGLCDIWAVRFVFSQISDPRYARVKFRHVRISAVSFREMMFILHACLENAYLQNTD